MMTIEFSDIYSKYTDVVDKCKESGQPIYLTSGGQNELIVMDTASFKKREQELHTQQLILESFAARLAGEKNYSLEESKKLVNKRIRNKQWKHFTYEFAYDIIIAKGGSIW